MDRLIKLLIKTKGTSTAIGGSVGILIIYLLWSLELLKEPNVLVWISIFIVFSSIGGSVDYYQSKLTEKDSAKITYTKNNV